TVFALSPIGSAVGWIGLVSVVIPIALILAFTPTGSADAWFKLVSDIVIAISSVLALIPTIFLLCLLALGYRRLRGGAGVVSTTVAFGIAAASMVAIPGLLNIWTELNVAILVNYDRTSPIPKWEGGTLAIFKPAGHDVYCGDFCQRALVSGAVSRFM